MFRIHIVIQIIEVMLMESECGDHFGRSKLISSEYHNGLYLLTRFGIKYVSVSCFCCWVVTCSVRHPFWVEALEISTCFAMPYFHHVSDFGSMCWKLCA